MTSGGPYCTLVLAVLCAAPLVSCAGPSEDEVESESVVEVRTSPAALGDVTALVRATAVVTPAPGAELVVVAPEAARIAEIPHATGEVVQAGDLLVRFDIPAMRAEVQKQQAEVLRAGAAVEATRAAVARARELFDRGVAARREVEEATRAHAEADGALAQARASLAAAEAVASRAEVRAAFGGVIVKRLHNPGDLVDASASDPVLRVVDLRRLEVVAWVPLADVARVTTGAPAHVTGAPVPAPGLRLTVVAPAAATDGDTATAPVRLRTNGVPPWPVGTPLQVEIEAEHHANVVLVPRAAIVRDGDETAVFVASGGQAHRRTVTLGLGDDERVEIASGLAAGEAVVTDGHAGLPDGTAIRVADDSDDDRRTPVGGREGGDRP